MAIKKQTIRSNQTIYTEGVVLSKEEIISMSEGWDEKQTLFFKKMLKQGGQCKINGVPFKILLKEKNDIDSTGDRPKTTPLIPGERTF
jgi:hypothetical protein